MTTTDPTTLIQEAAAALGARDRAGAAARLHTLVTSMARLDDKWDAVARMAALIGEVSLAREASERWAFRAPEDLTRQIIHAGRLAELGQVKEGLAHVRPLLAAHADDPSLNHFVGTAKSQLGDTHGADAALRRTLAKWPTAGVTWLTLANLKTYRDGDADVAALTDVIARVEARPGDLPPLARAQLLYAKAKMLIDAGDHDAGFDAVERGAALITPQRPYHASTDVRVVDDLISGFASGPGRGADQDADLGLTPSEASGSRAIFVMGLPRSGTTLVEQLLTHHSGVADGGEINLFSTALQPLNAPTLSNALASQAANPRVWNDAARVYDHLIAERFGPTGRIVDKTLINTRYVGLLRHVFPDARIIWLRRDPLDTAWSCLRTCFSQGLGWTFDQTSMAHAMAQEDRLHAHFSQADADAILTVPYEALAAEPETWSAKILAHAGLGDEKISRGFHRAKRAVTTSSVAQVRRPVSQAAVGAARPVAHRLAAFQAAYEALS